MTNFRRLSRFGIVNVYLLSEEDGLTVIDTGLPGSTGGIAKAAEQIGAPIKRILLTHGHGDHVGSLDVLHERFPDAEVLISARDARLLEKDKSLDPGEPQTKIKGSVPGTKTSPDTTPAAGRHGRIAAGDRRPRTHARALRLPRLPRPDAVLRRRLLDARRRRHLGQGEPALPAARPRHLAQADSAGVRKALRALDPARLAPGHGKVVEIPGRAMDKAIAKAS